MGKINGPWPKSNQFCMSPGYISLPNFRPFLPSVNSPENARKSQFWPVSISQNAAQMVVRSHRFRAILSMCSSENARKPPINLTCFAKFFGLYDLKNWQSVRKNVICFFISQGDCFCKFHEIWVKTLGDIAQKTVMDRRTDRHGIFIELLAAVKNNWLLIFVDLFNWDWRFDDMEALM